MHLSGLYIYPIKSARGISLQSAQLDPRGLQFDRRWMVVDDQGQFLTQRKVPRMALIHVSLGRDCVAVGAGGMSELTIPLQTKGTETVRVRIWDDSLDAFDAGADAGSWFSKFLGFRCRLVQMPEEESRFANPKYAPQNSPVSFVDAYPVLLMTEASVDDLNGRLQEPVPMNRFRPNVVISGSPAYEEDSWQRVKIGSVSFLVAKPCVRCAVPTVDQNTGVSGKEPIRTLRTYRTFDSKLCFGQNLVHESQGVLTIGDTVSVASR